MSVAPVKRQMLYFGILLLGIGFQANANTPAHAYQEASYLFQDIEGVRQNQGITQAPKKAGVQIAKTPLHVYSKGLEVFEKVSRYQGILGLRQATVPSLPSANVTPANVLQLMASIRSEVSKIKSHLGVASRVTDVDIDPSTTPSDVYELTWDTSFLMDGLIPPINPSFVFNNTIRITEALMVLSRKLNKTVRVPEIPLPVGKKPIDANIEGFKALFKIVELEKKVGIPVLRVPSFPAGNITPSDVYDTTNNLLAEITRMNVHLALPEVKNRQPNDGKITPNNVVKQMMIIQSLIDQLAA